MTVLIHGFWGQPSDWNTVLQKLPLGVQVNAPDLFLDSELSPHFALKDWAENFWRWADETFPDRKIQLVGYSMGARLAVIAALAKPERIERALFLSGNPVFKPEAAAERDRWEQEWAGNFLKMEWPELEAKWQELPVFDHAPALNRRKSPEMREKLGLALRQWSPRLHSFSAEDVRELPGRMEWAFGALDQKYLEVAKTLQELPVQGQITIIPKAGHRLLTEAADFISQWIQKGQGL